MSKLRVKYREKTIHLILDRAFYHLASLVAEKTVSFNIKLNFLSAYSPNLNSIERLWTVISEKVLNNRFFKGEKDFKEALNGFFDDMLPKIGKNLDAQINDNFQMFKTKHFGVF